MAVAKGIIANNRLTTGVNTDYGLDLNDSGSTDLLCVGNINLTNPSRLYSHETGLVTHYQAIKLSNGSSVVFEVDKDGNVNQTGDITCAVIYCGSLQGNRLYIDNVDINGNDITFTGDGHVYSSGNLYLGSGSNYISSANNLYIANNITIGNDVSIGGFFNNGLYPKTGNSYDLGSNTLKWKDIYSGRLYTTDAYVADDLAVTSNATIGGDLTVTGTIQCNRFYVDNVTINYDYISFDGDGHVYSSGNLYLGSSSNYISSVNNLYIGNDIIAAGYIYGSTLILTVDAQVGRDLQVGDDLTVNDDAIIHGNVTMDDEVTIGTHLGVPYIYSLTDTLRLRAVPENKPILLNYKDNGTTKTVASVEIYNGRVTRIASFGAVGVNPIEFDYKVYCASNLEVNGDISCDDLSVLGYISNNLVPSSSSSYDLGSTTHKWNNLWLSGDLSCEGNIYTDGGYIGVGQHDTSPSAFVRIGYGSGAPSGGLPGCLYYDYSDSHYGYLWINDPSYGWVKSTFGFLRS